MQFNLMRAFPYPVLRPDVDDYTDGQMQVIVDFNTEDDAATISANIFFQLNVKEIRDEISAGRAKYTVVFACRDTYYRYVHQSADPETKITFPAGKLRGEIQIFSYVASVSNITQYQCPWINNEFGSGPFNFPTGSILAIDRPQQIYLDREAFRPLQSIFMIVKDDALGKHECKIIGTDTKVHIKVHSNLKAIIDQARNNQSHRAVLMNSIYFGAVMQCIVWIQGKNGDGQRWAEIISQRCKSVGIDFMNDDAYSITDKLLQHPIQKVETYVFEGATE